MAITSAAMNATKVLNMQLVTFLTIRKPTMVAKITKM